MFRADLHCHTTFSDGTMTPFELLSEAKEKGLNGISITDHDTIDAYPEAVVAAKELGISLGSGVEFSCTYRNLSVHVLAYDFDLKEPGIQNLCYRHQQRRTLRNKAILEKLSRLSMPITEEELLAIGQRTVGRPHIGQIMMKKGYVLSIKEAFVRYIGDGKPCFDPGIGISVEETLNIIHQGRGKAFIAHPHLLEGASKIKGLLQLPFDGIECYYARFPLEQEKRWTTIAEEKRLLISGGSDFHGSIKDYNRLGSSWINEEHFLKIFQHPLVL